jgi:hypothetical protein
MRDDVTLRHDAEIDLVVGETYRWDEVSMLIKPGVQRIADIKAGSQRIVLTPEEAMELGRMLIVYGTVAGLGVDESAEN